MVLTPAHTNFLLPSSAHSSPLNYSVITTLTIDNSTLLEHIKTALSEDDEWHKEITYGNTGFTTKGKMPFYKE